MGSYLENLNYKTKALLLFALSLTLLLLNLDEPMIYILDEAKNAECAREMFESGNYLVPYFNGQLRTDKPPLHYFFMVLSYHVFGVSAFSARFFSAIFGALTVLITYLFARKVLNEKTAWLSGIVLVSSLHFNFQMRLAVPDPYLIFFVTACFMCFYLYLTGRKKLWLWLMYAAFGLGTLTKGPVAIGLPGLVMLIFLLIRKQLNGQLIKAFRIPAGIIIVAAIAFPWYYLNYIETNGAWTAGFFLKHNLNRYTETMEGHGGFFLLPALMVILGLLPFGIFSVQSLYQGWQKRGNEAVLYCFLIAVIIIIFFSFSQTKLPNYTAPAYPFAAILVAYFLSELKEGNLNARWNKIAFLVYLIIAFAIPVGVFIAFSLDVKMREFAYLGFYFTALPLGALLGWKYLRMSNKRLFVYTVAISFILTNVLFFAKAYPLVYANNPVSASFAALQHQEKLVYYKKMNPAYVFNLKRVIPGFDRAEELKNYLEEHPQALIITRKSNEAELDSIIGVSKVFEQQDTFERPVTAIYQKEKPSGPSPSSD